MLHGHVSKQPVASFEFLDPCSTVVSISWSPAGCILLRPFVSVCPASRKTKFHRLVDQDSVRLSYLLRYFLASVAVILAVELSLVCSRRETKKLITFRSENTSDRFSRL
jgi:hypothetical protein